MPLPHTTRITNTTMVLKTDIVKELKNGLVTGFLVRPRSDQWSNQ